MRFVCAVLAVLALAVAPGSAQAVTASVVPDTVSVESGGHATVHVLVVNDTQVPIEQTQLRALTAGSSGITVAPRDTAPRTVAAGDATRFIVDVGTDEVLRGERSITLLVRYRKNHLPGRASATLKVGPPPPVDPGKVAALTVDGSFSAMRSGRKTKAYIRVRNATASKLTVGPVAVTAPNFLKPPESSETTLPANGTANLDVPLEVNDDVRPGKYTMLFDVPILHGEELVTTLSAAKEVEVSIEGESELLKAFGVPTLLLLPGALFLGFAACLWNLQVWRHPADLPAPKIDLASIAFVAASIIFSFFLLSASAALKWADFFESYSRGKIFILALVSAVAGIVLYLVLMAVRNRWQAWRTPAADDSQTTVLRKLKRQGMGVSVPKYQQAGKSAYRIQALRAGRPVTWFAPRIKVAWTDTSDANVHKQMADAVKSNNAKRLAKALKNAKQDDKVNYSWDEETGSSTADGPFAASTAAFGTENGAETIVYWDE